MTITIVPICYDCNEELSNFDKFLDKKYKFDLPEGMVEQE